jgi:SAM-dependent methyltransferase
MKDHTDLLNLIAKKINAKMYIEIGVFNPSHNFDKIEVENKIGVDPDPNAKAMFKMISDEFFSMYKNLGIAIVDGQKKYVIPEGEPAIARAKADLVWIDGLHHADQVKKDIQNAWDILTPGGVIAVHDCNPHSEAITYVPRDSREWTGDVYKTISNIKSEKFTIDFDYGCCVIRKPFAFWRYKIDDFDEVGEVGGIIHRKVNLTQEEANQIGKKLIDTYTGDGRRGRTVVVSSDDKIEWHTLDLQFANHEITWEQFDKNRTELLNLVSLEKGVSLIEAWT